MAVLIPWFGNFENGERVQSSRTQTGRVAAVIVALLGTAAAGRAQMAAPGGALTKVTAERVQRRGYRSPVDVLDVRYRTMVTLAYLESEVLIGAPQNPRRITVGFDFRLK